MKPLAKFLMALSAIAILGAIVLQKNAVATLREENQRLQADFAEGKTLTHERDEALKFRNDYQEVEKLRDGNHDLPRLRNEIGQLRRQKKDLEALRVETQRLGAGLNAKTPAPSAPVILARESWKNAGLASPEAALQTFFWAMRENNVALLRQCFSPEFADKFRGQSDDDLRRGFDQMVKDTGSYEVAAKKNISEDEILLGIRIGGQEGAVPLKKFGQEWKVNGF